MEKNIKNIMDKLIYFKIYAHLLQLETIKAAEIYHSMFLEKFNTSDKYTELYNFGLNKVTYFALCKKFNEDCESTGLTDEEKRQDIINNVLCYSCCDPNYEPIVQILVEGLEADINRKNKNINLTPFELVNILPNNERLLNMLINYTEQNEKTSEKNITEDYSQDLSSYISSILRKNKNIKKKLTILNELVEKEDFVPGTGACNDCLLI